MRGMERIDLPTARNLRHELDVIASCELGDILDAWDTGLSHEQASRLARYLTSELSGYGMLSVEKARECGVPLATERREARAVLARIATRLEAQ